MDYFVNFRRGNGRICVVHEGSDSRGCGEWVSSSSLHKKDTNHLLVLTVSRHGTIGIQASMWIWGTIASLWRRVSSSVSGPRHI